MSGGPVIPLGRTPPPEPEPEPTRPPTLHGIATAVLAISASAFVISSVGYLTVTWSGTPRRAVIATILFSALLGLSSFSVSVLTAARHTYTRGSERRGPGEGS